MTANRRSQFTGAAGRARLEQELQHQKEVAEQRKNQSKMPFRFRVAVGETREICILDDAPDFFQHEHNMKGPDGFWNVFTGCVKEFDNCPVCEQQGKESYYAMYLSIIDLSPYTNKKTNEVVEWSRKLLVVKPAQQKKFMRFYEKHGTLRGAIFEMTRDGDKEPSIGNDIEFVDEWIPEEDLKTYQREWKDKDGKKQHEDCSVPYDYLALFEEPTTEALRAMVGGKAPAGSRAYEREALKEEPAARPSRRAAPAPAREPEKAEADDWEAADDTAPWEDAKEEPKEEAPAARPSRRAAAAAPPPAEEPARRSLRRAAR